MSVADIASNQIVSFELKFSTNDIKIDPINYLNYDAVRCYMINNSQDTRFWTQTAYDGYYVCEDAACVTPGVTWEDDSSPSDIDWKTPIIDDDYNDKFCTPHTTDSATYACEDIKCVIERKFDTGYLDDFRFQPVEGTPD